MTKITYREKQGGGSVASYTMGFLLSLMFTLAAYFAVVNRLFVGRGLLAFIIVLAFAQFAVQLFFFLHLAHESGPRWKLLIFLATFGLMLVVVLGSVWIMNHLNNNMMLMTPEQMDKYMTNHL